MAGSIARKMLGFADEIAEGFSKGIGDAGTIKASVNKISSNMTPKQAKFLKNFGKNNAGDAAKAVSRSQAYAKNTKQAAANAFKQMGRDDLAKNVTNLKGMPITQAQKSARLNGVKVDRVAGIKDPTFGNRLGDAFGGGVKDTYTGIKAGQSFSQALSGAYMNGDKLRMDRVAGTFVGASAAARLATGGGLYKDRNGSTNIIGLPFI
jgi:hypothetical protein